MYKSLLDIFNDKQLELLRTKMWWVADQHKPFLLKFAVKDDFVLIRTTHPILRNHRPTLAMGSKIERGYSAQR
jgi:hypothetical protein